jgi:hypothetical protein
MNLFNGNLILTWYGRNIHQGAMADCITYHTNSAIDNHESDSAPPKPRFTVTLLADGMACDAKAEPYEE